MELEEKKKEYITLEREDGEIIEHWRKIYFYDGSEVILKNILKIKFGGRTIRFLCLEGDSYMYYIFHGKDINYMIANLNGIEGLIL